MSERGREGGREGEREGVRERGYERKERGRLSDMKVSAHICT